MLCSHTTFPGDPFAPLPVLQVPALPSTLIPGVQQAETIRAALTKRMADGRLLFDSVQATWNVLEQSAGTCISVVTLRCPTIRALHQIIIVDSCLV